MRVVRVVEGASGENTAPPCSAQDSGLRDCQEAAWRAEALHRWGVGCVRVTLCPDPSSPFAITPRGWGEEWASLFRNLAS